MIRHLHIYPNCANVLKVVLARLLVAILQFNRPEQTLPNVHSLLLGRRHGTGFHRPFAMFQKSFQNIPICSRLTLGLIGLLCFIILFLFLFFNCYMHCFSMVFSVVMYGALVSVSVLRRLRCCRHIIIIIIVILVVLLLLLLLLLLLSVVKIPRVKK